MERLVTALSTDIARVRKHTEFTGTGQSGTRSVLDMARSVKTVQGDNGLYVFTLP
jgi:hypothetical protein